MNHQGVILRKLRLILGLSIKGAAKRINRSAGWLSEVENGKGSARIYPAEFERIIGAYEGENYRKQFPLWIANASKPEPAIKSDLVFAGAILKYLRKKARLRLVDAAEKANISIGHLSHVESGTKGLTQTLRDTLMRIYGYSPASFRNFATEDKRAKNIPVRYKLDMLLVQMDEERIERLFITAKDLLQPIDSKN